VRLRPFGPGHRDAEDEGVFKPLSWHGGCLFRSGCEPDFEGAPKIVLADSAEEREELTSVTMDPEEKTPLRPIPGALCRTTCSGLRMYVRSPLSSPCLPTGQRGGRPPGARHRADARRRLRLGPSLIEDAQVRCVKHDIIACSC
jgi:hypothetical protein